MNKASSEWKFLILTAGVVCLLGAQTLRDFFSSGDFSTVEISESSFASSRAPASLKPSSLKPVAVGLKENLLEWNFNCHKSPVAETAVKGDQLRMKGRSCGHDFNSTKVVIVNETNGFTASVFAKGQLEYETDFIRLREGANRIRVQYQNPAGQRSETVLTINSTI